MTRRAQNIKTGLTWTQISLTWVLLSGYLKTYPLHYIKVYVWEKNLKKRVTRQVWIQVIMSSVNINNTFLRQSEPMSLWFNPRYEMWVRGQSSYHRSDLIVNTNTRHINDTLASAPVICHNFTDFNAICNPLVNGLPDVPCPRSNLITETSLAWFRWLDEG